MKKAYFILLASLGVVLIIAGCASGSIPTPTQPGSFGSTTPTTTAATTSTSVTTFQALAANAQSTYTQVCSVCHGADGAGGGGGSFPALWGSKATLGTYSGNKLFSDGQGMLNFISTRMPLTSPGSLTHQQYTELLAFILLKNNLVSPTTTFDESQLKTIAIK